jgi:hypothetical protein
MATSLDDFAQDACADVLRDGALLPLLEAHTTEQTHVFALANLPQGEERQRAFFTLGARFGNDPASGDAPVTDVFLRSEAWVRLVDDDEALLLGRVSEDPQRVEAVIVTHTHAHTGAVDGRLYVMRRDDGGRLVGLTERADLRDAVAQDNLSGAFLAGMRASPPGVALLPLRRKAETASSRPDEARLD